MSWRFGFFYEGHRHDPDGENNNPDPDEKQDGATHSSRHRTRYIISATSTRIATIFIAIFTGGVVAIGYMQWNVFKETNKTLRNTNYYNSRAWIVPFGVKIDSDITVGSHLRLKILYQNSGKEPAKSMIHSRHWYPIEVTIDAVDEPYVDWSETQLPIDFDCKQTARADRIGATVYPVATYVDYKYVFTGPQFGTVPQSLKDKKTSVVIYGCFTYDTFGALRQSPYCFYMQHSRRGPVEDSTFDPCPIVFEKAT